MILKVHAERLLSVISWLVVVSGPSVQAGYSIFVCHYPSWYRSSLFACALSIPALIWQLRRVYWSAIAASTGLLFWIVQTNHIQCVSDEGPFVGGLGPVYLLVFGLTTSITLGFLVTLICGKHKQS